MSRLCVAIRRSPVAVLLLHGAASALRAQMPGLPVLQNAFANPGITVGLTYGRSPDYRGLGGALAWAPGSARFVISAGAGTLDPDDTTAKAAYGARISVPVLHLKSDALGVGAFGGFGSSSLFKTSITVAGLSAGYRRPIGGLGVSLHVAPSYQHHSVSVGGKTLTSGLFRFSTGIDVSFGGRFGATLGVETGAVAARNEPGPSGAVLGLGVSYALRRVK